MRSKLTRGLVSTLLLGIAFFAGLSVDHVALAAKKTEAYRPLDVFAEVLAAVQNSYVEEVDERELVYGAIDGLVGGSTRTPSSCAPTSSRRCGTRPAASSTGWGWS